MTETLFGAMASNEKPRKHYDRMVAALELYAAKGFTLAHVSERHIMDRSLRTLQTYCNAAGIIFPDWCPRRLRPKKVRVAKLKRRRKGI